MIVSIMKRNRFMYPAALGLVLALAISASVADEPPKASKGKKPQAAPVVGEITTGLEPRAVEILKATSAKLAAAKTVSFTAVVSYENPSTFGPPLLYTTRNEVTLQRPDKLRIVTPGDGPRSEFYYDGKKMMAVAPAEKLVASADAPPTIDATLRAAFQNAAIYYPFSDLIVSDPWADLAEVVQHAFYIGQSQVVGGVTTDMVAVVTDDVFVQVWIGADDKLPRMIRALYKHDPARLRHQTELSDWKLDSSLPAETFTLSTAGMQAIEFARPDPQLPKAAEPPPPPKSAKK
jgi:hypothetical protein